MTQPDLANPMPESDSSQGQEIGTAPEPQSQPQENSAPWAKYMEGIPTSLAPIVEARYKEWDGDVTRMVQKVHSEYEPLKAYQPLYEAGYDPQQLSQLAEVINTNPRQLYDALVANFADEWGLNAPATPEQGQLTPDDDEDTPQYDPKILELQSTVDVMADILLERHRQEQESLEDQQLDAYLTGLKQKHGEFDERVVLGLMNAGVPGEEAVQQYQQSIQAALQQNNRPPAPRILGSGGGVPTEQVDLKSPKSRKEVIAQMLANSKRE